MASPSSPASPVKDNADYVLAVEQLAHGAFAERRAAVDTLVGLADGYLADTSLDEKTRNTNAQHIINRLCEYIRSPYALAGEYDFKAYRGSFPESRKAQQCAHPLL